MSLEKLLSFWRSDPEIGKNMTAWETTEARQPQTTPFPDRLHPLLAEALRAQEVTSLFSHQIEAWDLAAAGRNVMLVTGTASGKTLAYHLPVLDYLVRHRKASALYLFPTKALAQDQMDGLEVLTGSFPEEDRIPFGTYDGDTPTSARRALRKTARLLITNPDMLHLGILPHHPTWSQFLRQLSYIVIDESHAYRGVFGSHVANVLRRLERILSFYGASPRYFLTSATIGNPLELARALTGAEFRLVDGDGSSRGSQNFLIYNPPLVNEELGIRRSALAESVRLASDLDAYDVQTIVFAGTRRGVELALTDLRRESMVDGGQMRGYRSGYLPAERREIEAGLRDGSVRVVAATNALELGIDIGRMGAAVLAGFPGTIASTWQQAGRAGRGSDLSAAVLVATASPIDQFLARHPAYLFGRSPEEVRINPDNLLILFNHLRCALFELPFHSGEGYGGFSAGEIQEILDLIVQNGEAHRSNGKVTWISDQYPADRVSLRSASAARVLLQANLASAVAVVGEVDLESAHWMVHPGAVYLHQGRMYLVQELDLDGFTASLKEADLDFYTVPRTDTSVSLVQEKITERIPGGQKSFGELEVTSQVTGYQKIQWETRLRLDVIPLEMPPSQLQTTGYWLTLAESTVQGLREVGMWTNDPNDYGPGWSQVRLRVRARDGYLCQNCGAPENGNAHHVHHKTPFRAFLTPEQANRLENLVTLCPGCHQKAEAVVRMRSGLAGLAYTLGHLAPLYLMCDTRDLGIHSDPQSPMTEGKPTITIYDRVPGGIGLCDRLYEIHRQVIQAALELVGNCPCEEGCPSCVGPPGELGFGGKAETQALLEALS